MSQIGAKFVQECNVQNEEQMNDLFNKIEAEWGHLDGMLHAIAFSDKNELNGRYADTTRENFKNTMDISVYSLVDFRVCHGQRHPKQTLASKISLQHRSTIATIPFSRALPDRQPMGEVLGKCLVSAPCTEIMQAYCTSA